MNKKLGLWSCTALVVGNMIGSGIFLLPASLAPYGGWSLLGWLVTTAGSLCLALVFAWLSAAVPRAGGLYAYTRVGFGPFAGFMVAWGYWLSIVCTNAAIAVAMVSYLAVFWPALNTVTVLGAGAALFVILALAVVNCRGVRTASVMQLATTALKLLPLFALAVGGLFAIQPDLLFSHDDKHTGLQAVTSSATLTLWAFLGLESATFLSAVAKEPEKTIPRATLIGTVLTAIVYILATAVVQGLVPGDVLAKSPAPFAEAAKRLWGEGASWIIALGAAIACFGALNGWTLLGGQLPVAMAEDGLFPRAFRRVNRQGAPDFGIVVTSVLAAMLVLANFTRSRVDLFTFAILLATLSTLIPYVFCSLSYVILKRGRGLPPLRLTIASLAFLYSLWAIAGAGQETVYWGFLLLLSGCPIYVLMQRGSANRSETLEPL